jgi:Protein of unknown function (DUF3631)
VILLQDIYTLFEDKLADRLLSGELATALAKLEGRPWGEWKGARPISPKAVANLLAPFRIAPIEMRIGSRVLRGYRIEQFEDAFARYVAAATGTATVLRFRKSQHLPPARPGGT